MAVSAFDVVKKFAPKAHPNYVAAFRDGEPLLAASGVDRPLRIAHFMAQCLHETGSLTILVENGNYTAKNLGRMWDGGNWHHYFKDRDECVAMAEQCKTDHGMALFSLVYGNRMGNGPPKSRDGWTYRGRGILQTTGRDAYSKFGKRCGVDFVGNPDSVTDAQHALKPALAEWDDGNLNIAADHNDIEVITKRINGGLVGLGERKAWFAKIWPFVSSGISLENSLEWRVQERLDAAGFDCGAPDGVVGPNTRSAIIGYRKVHHLTLRPDISQDLLQSLGM